MAFVPASRGSGCQISRCAPCLREAGVNLGLELLPGRLVALHVPFSPCGISVQWLLMGTTLCVFLFCVLLLLKIEVLGFPFILSFFFFNVFSQESVIMVK